MNAHAGPYIVAGLMSGTSLDGVDIAVAEFNLNGEAVEWKLINATTVGYPEAIRKKLDAGLTLSQPELDRLDSDLGEFFGRVVSENLGRWRLNPDFIASHGHTILHQPEERLTLQIGNAQKIADSAGTTVISDFRSKDVALGGQGAPLVPAGDRDLFPGFSGCLNLGGIANISFSEEGAMKAFDIVPCNMVMNALAGKLGSDFDRDGRFAERGNICTELLQELDELPYYHQLPPKSIGKEWVVNNCFPAIEKYAVSAEDALRTFTEHVVHQIASVARKFPVGERILVTGGGAMNRFLVDQLKNNMPPEVVIPDEKVVHYKEAIIFAYLGLLRMLGRVNVLSSVTGSTLDSCSGKITQPKKI